MTMWIVIAIAFVGVFSLIMAVGSALQKDEGALMEERLGSVSQKKSKKGKGTDRPDVLSRPLESNENFFEELLNRFLNLNRLIEQSDTNVTVQKVLMLSAVFSGGCIGVGVLFSFPGYILPPLGILGAFFPIFWLSFRRKRRMKQFEGQLPEALELIARALRSGQSLPYGFNMVAKEMDGPIAKEFGRAFEEQNLGCPLEETLESMTDRVPNLDLKFFATAVILQRQTGGDLAEILDNIGELIRERFKIWGAIQALTGEGRISGIVLLAMPFGLFAVLYFLNRDYVMRLFEEPLGRKMIAVALIMQVLGAVSIKKIITIKV